MSNTNLTPSAVGPNKAIAAVLAGAISTILVWVLNTYAHAAIPDLVQGAITTVITAGLVYYVPHGGDA